VKFGGSVIRMDDPKGRWTFEARSAAVKAQSSEGPFLLSPADCTYTEKGKEPVRMRADSADLQKQAGRVTLRGSVVVSSGGWRLESDSVTYDLHTGKVVSPGRTKVTYSPEAAQPSRSSGGGGAER
jgi:lipopolysaccharide assembly outer membrane protein LptD (OstA)